MKYKKLVDYLSNLNPRTDRDALTLSSLVKIAEIGGLNNLEAKSTLIDTPEQTAPANMYTITFIDSGGGKDKPLRDIDKNLLFPIYDDFRQRALDSKIKRDLGLVEEAKELYKDNESAQKKYVSENRPRKLQLELSDATLEGFVSMRQAYSQAGWGGLFVKISEFGDYISSGNNARTEFLAMLGEVFDYGDNNVKGIKSEKDNVPVYNVPSNAAMHTSPAGLLENNKDQLMTFLNRGIARRAYVCYLPEAYKSKTEDIEEIIAQKREKRVQAKAMEHELRTYFSEFYFKTKVSDNVVAWNNTNNTFTFTEEADMVVERYMASNEILSEKIKRTAESVGLISEIIGRQWKVIKLATILAAFEHPENKTVERAEVEEAIRITDSYGKYFEQFYKDKPNTDSMKLYNYLLENEGEWVTKTMIREQRFISKQNDTPRWIQDNIPLVKEIFEDHGYLLDRQPNGSIGEKYRVVKTSLEELHELAEAEQLIKDLKADAKQRGS